MIPPTREVSLSRARRRVSVLRRQCRLGDIEECWTAPHGNALQRHPGGTAERSVRCLDCKKEFRSLELRALRQLAFDDRWACSHNFRTNDVATLSLEGSQCLRQLTAQVTNFSQRLRKLSSHSKISNGGAQRNLLKGERLANITSLRKLPEIKSLNFIWVRIFHSSGRELYQQLSSKSENLIFEKKLSEGRKNLQSKS